MKLTSFFRQNPKIVGYVPPEKLKELGVTTPVPILDVPVADQRKWCKDAQEWLDLARVPGPCRLMAEEGVCRLSPAAGKCLLLLPFTHPDWQPAFRWRYDPEQGAMVDRDEPVHPPQRQPIALEVLERCE